MTKWFPECETFFPRGQKFYFDTAEEAVKNIVFLLANESQREQMRNAVTEHAWEHHTYKIRFEQMMNDLHSVGVLDKEWNEGQSRLRSQADAV